MTASARSSAVVAVLVALVAFVAVAVTMGDIGLTWDEPAYMGSAQAYGEWLTVVGQSVARLDLAQPFSEPVLRAYWQHDSTDQHPPVGKYAPAISWRLLRGLVGEITALRLGNAAIFAGLAALVYLLAASLAGMAGGLFAAASLVLMPRLFFHGHLTTLDIPVAFFWTLTVWLFWRWSSVVHHRGADDRRRLWPALAALGLCYGLALGTKNTSFFLPPILLLWALIFRRNRRTLALLIGMGLVAVPVFLLTWPALYSDLPGRLLDYLNRMTLGHWDIVQYYLGQSYARPPWHYPFVAALVTVPATVLAMALLGLLRVVRAGRTDAGGWLIVFNACGPLCFFAFVSSQVYGAERLFLVVFPYLAILAGMGFAVVWRWAQQAAPLRSRGLVVGEERPPQPPNLGGSSLPSPSIGRGAGGEGQARQALPPQPPNPGGSSLPSPSIGRGAGGEDQARQALPPLPPNLGGSSLPSPSIGRGAGGEGQARQALPPQPPNLGGSSLPSPSIGRGAGGEGQARQALPPQPPNLGGSSLPSPSIGRGAGGEGQAQQAASPQPPNLGGSSLPSPSIGRGAGGEGQARQALPPQPPNLGGSSLPSPSIGRGAGGEGQARQALPPQPPNLGGSSLPSPSIGRGAGGEGQARQALPPQPPNPGERSLPSPSIGRGAGGEGQARQALPPQPPNPGGSSLPSPSIGRGAGGESQAQQALPPQPPNLGGSSLPSPSIGRGAGGEGQARPPQPARTVLASALAVLLLLPGALGIATMHPHELSYFSGAIGGVRGAERLGLELTYWCETYRAALPFLNAVPEQAPSVWTEEEGVLYTYRQHGLLRADINVGGRVVKAGPLAATYALIQRRPSGYTPEIEELLRDRRPVFVVRQGDMPLAYVFRIGD